MPRLEDWKMPRVIRWVLTKKNKVIDYLVISDWNNPIKELDNWIQNVE